MDAALELHCLLVDIVRLDGAPVSMQERAKGVLERWDELGLEKGTASAATEAEVGERVAPN